MYRPHYVHIRKEDYEKAEKILEKHYRSGEIDDHSSTMESRRGVQAITYCIHPYIYEDFESIVREFIESGIQIL